MRTSDWQFLGYLMVSVGGMLAVTASIAIFYLEGQFTKSLIYSQYYYR